MTMPARNADLCMQHIFSIAIAIMLQSKPIRTIQDAAAKMPAAEGPTGAASADGHRQLRFTRPPQGMPAPGSAQAGTAGIAGGPCAHDRTAAAQWGICSSCAIRDVALPLASMSVLPCAIGKQSPAPAGGQKPSPAASGADGAPSAAGPPQSAGSGQSSGELEVAHAGNWITLSCPVLVLACLIS